MSSILTNTSAMVALQSLKATNKGMGQIQGQISTGLKISTAKDNASTWAIAQTMRGDVTGMKQIKDGLSTALAAVNVGRNATESMTELLTQIKDKVIAAGAAGADVAKIDTDITNLRNQISTVVNSASFNGLNFVNNGQSSNILASLDRATGGSATTSAIAVTATDLRVGVAAARPAVFETTNTTGATDGGGYLASTEVAAAGNATIEFDAANEGNLTAGTRIEVTIGSKTASYTITAEDEAATTTADVVAVKMKAAIENLGAGVSVQYDSGTPGTLVLTNDNADSVSVRSEAFAPGSGGLDALGGISLTNEANRTAALATVETAMTSVINAAANLGSAQQRLETQQEFIGKLADSVTQGIGAMVDADMEEASARLQALQVQQQLGVQALSIANQAPQSVLSLFR